MPWIWLSYDTKFNLIVCLDAEIYSFKMRYIFETPCIIHYVLEISHICTGWEIEMQYVQLHHENIPSSYNSPVQVKIIRNQIFHFYDNECIAFWLFTKTQVHLHFPADRHTQNAQRLLKEDVSRFRGHTELLVIMQVKSFASVVSSSRQFQVFIR